MRIRTLAMLIVVFLLYTQASCGKLNCDRSVHSFELLVRAYPDKEIIVVGDTIWFEIDSPTRFYDNVSDDTVDYRGAANLGSGMGVYRLAATGQFIEPAVPYFDFVLVEGMLLRSGYREGSGNEYRFIEKNNRYRFLLGVIAKTTGTYRVGFSRASNVYRNHDYCTKAGFTINFADTDQHYPLHPDYVPGPPLVGGVYYFKVE